MKFCAGDMVEHETFGRGSVDSVAFGRVVVDFDEGGKRELALNSVVFTMVSRGTIEMGRYDGALQAQSVAASIASVNVDRAREEWRPPIRPRSAVPPVAAAAAEQTLESRSALPVAARADDHEKPPPIRRRRVTVDFDQVRRDHQSGKSIGEIAAGLGLTKSALTIRLLRAGIQLGRNPEIDRAAYYKGHAEPKSEAGVERRLQRKSAALRDEPASGPPARSIAELGETDNSPTIVKQKEKRMPAAKNLDRDELVRLYGEGYSTSQIGEKVGASNSTVGYHLKQAGVEMRKGRARKRDDAAAAKPAKIGRPKRVIVPVPAEKPQTSESATSALPVPAAAVMPGQNGHATSNGHARVRFRFVEVEVDGAAVADAIAALHKALEAKL